MNWLEMIKGKLGDWNHVSQLVEDARRVLGDAQMPTRLVLTNGCFDIMHPGHVWRLHEASLRGDILIVSLDADEDVLRAKRKLAMPWADRAQMVACLPFVAGVTWHMRAIRCVPQYRLAPAGVALVEFTKSVIPLKPIVR